uniref:Uncharacterized protein n=1 Tax=Oryza glumipatula TaxID=40148 RepID=A0A0D9Z530_9ORYZ
MEETVVEVGSNEWLEEHHGLQLLVLLPHRHVVDLWRHRPAPPPRSLPSCDYVAVAMAATHPKNERCVVPAAALDCAMELLSCSK